MSKVIAGAAMLAGAVAVGAIEFELASTGVGLAALPFLTHVMEALALGGISMEAGAVADALTQNRGQAITTRQPAAFRQVVRGRRRIGGTIIYQSTTGSHKDQYNFIIALAGIPLYAITGLYLDGRLVYWDAGSADYSTYNNSNFGGSAAGGSHTGPDGQQYDFGGKVFCDPWFGQQTSTQYSTAIQANDPTWGPSANGVPFVGGCTYVYLKIEYDETLFPALPEIKFAVAGKWDIYDPRTGTKGYTDNWALHVADHIKDPLAGFGDQYINEDQLIAAANICDEQVALAAGGSESRYTLSCNYDTSMSPGSILQKMMDAAGGRVRQIGGEWHIFPAAWTGASLSFSGGDMCGGVESVPMLGIDELCNRVTGTYTAPNYPYNVAGDLYDSNGFYDGSTENTFPFAWQPTNYPQYARDPDHGYATAEDLNADSGVQGAWATGQTWNEDDVVTHNGAIWKSLIDSNTTEPTADPTNGNSQFWSNGANILSSELSLDWGVISITQAQRLAKIFLMRKRFQGRFRLPMFLTGWRTQSLDVLQMTLPELGWADKLLEADQPVLQAVQRGENEPPALQVMVPVAETDPSVYAWSTAEEQTVYAALARPTSGAGAVQPPTAMSLLSSAATAVVQPDGTIVPRIQVMFSPPLDAYVTQVQVQYRVSGTSTWFDAPSIDVSNATGFIANVIAGQNYDVRIRSQRGSGASSAWVEIDGFTAGLVLNALSSDTGIGPGSMVGIGKTDGTAVVQFKPFTANIANRSVSYFPSGAQFVTGLAQKTKYYGYVVDNTLADGDLTAVATTNPADYRGKPGYYFIDSVVTPAVDASGSGGTYYPSNYEDTGDRTTQSPEDAYDGDTSTFAVVSGSCYQGPPVSGEASDPVISSGDCIFEDFAAVAPSTGTTLSVDCSVTAVGSGGSGGSITITANVGGTATTLFSATSTTARATYTLAIASGTNLSTVSVEVTATPPNIVTGTGSRERDVSANVYEIFIS